MLNISHVEKSFQYISLHFTSIHRRYKNLFDISKYHTFIIHSLDDNDNDNDDDDDDDYKDHDAAAAAVDDGGGGGGGGGGGDDDDDDTEYNSDNDNGYIGNDDLRSKALIIN